MNNPKNILVTGGCGFVGRHLIHFLLSDRSNSKNITIIDNLSTGINPSMWLPKTFEEKMVTKRFISFTDKFHTVVFINNDLISYLVNTDRQELENLSVLHQIYHLASVVGGRSNIEGDPMSVAIDLAIDSILFRWIIKNKKSINHVLYASSSAAYPITLQGLSYSQALAEDKINFTKTLGMPDMTYGWSKLTGEYLSHLASNHYGLNIACVRPFSGYGGDQDHSYPIPAIAQRVARRDNPLVIWGTGEQARDFVHIDDCIEAMILTCNIVSDGSAVNIGTGIATNFLEVASILSDLANYQPKITPLVNKPTGVQTRYSDPTHSIKTLKWSPKISLQEGLQRVLHEQELLLNQNKKQIIQR